MSREMKTSNVPWLTDIPEAWKVERGKAILSLQKRPVRDTDEVITCFRDGEVVLRSERRTEGFTMSDKEIGYQGINKGDIVIHGMDGFAGAMGVSKSTGKGSPVLVVCTPKYDAVPQFIIYYLRALAMTDVFIALSTGIRERSCDLRWNKIAELEFILPPAIEQQAIADFLDKKCGEIDEMVSLQEKIIEELKAYKQSVIFEAVTKGLNPDAPMKDSGIEWIGQIPEHWGTSKVSRLYDIKLGKMLQPNQERPTDTYEYYLCAMNVGQNKLKVEPLKQMWIGEEEKEQYSIKTGDLLVVEGGDVASSAIFTEDFKELYYQNALHRVRPLTNHSNRYLRYFLMAAKGIGHIDLNCNKATISHFTKEKFAALTFPVIPIREEALIVNFLDTKCSEIDSLIALKQSKIESLKEFKKSIIYEYVTGKKEVML